MYVLYSDLIGWNYWISQRDRFRSGVFHEFLKGVKKHTETAAIKEITVHGVVK